MHPCNAMSALVAAPASEAHCDHHVAVDAGAGPRSSQQETMNRVTCTDLGKSAPDSRPPVAESLVLTLAQVPAFAAAHELSPSIPLRIESAAPEPPRPLRLRYAELLI
jgi:hypothetical protein